MPHKKKNMREDNPNPRKDIRHYFNKRVSNIVISIFDIGIFKTRLNLKPNRSLRIFLIELIQFHFNFNATNQDSQDSCSTGSTKPGGAGMPQVSS